MASFNKLILVGNLTRDPQLKNLPSGSSVCEFGIACSEKYKTKSGEEREDVLFLDCSIFGKGAEVFTQYQTKGSQVLLEGRLKLQTWDDKEGNKRHKHVMNVDQFKFLGSPKGERSSRPAQKSDSGEFSPEDVPF